MFFFFLTRRRVGKQKKKRGVLTFVFAHGATCRRATLSLLKQSKKIYRTFFNSSKQNQFSFPSCQPLNHLSTHSNALHTASDAPKTDATPSVALSHVAVWYRPVSSPRRAGLGGPAIARKRARAPHNQARETMKGAMQPPATCTAQQTKRVTRASEMDVAGPNGLNRARVAAEKPAPMMACGWRPN